MIFIKCTTCKATVQHNPTGICLACQRGFLGRPQEDAFKSPTKKLVEDIEKLDALKKREKEIENALKGKGDKMEKPKVAKEFASKTQKGTKLPKKVKRKVK